jgi:HSP20 family protein
MILFPAFSRLAVRAWPLLLDEGYGTPLLDVSETATDFVIELELPATPATDIRVSACEGALVIEGVKGESIRQSLAAVARFLRVESAAGPFRRRVDLPPLARPEAARARLRDGLLVVTVPKAAAPDPRQTP